MVNARGTRKNEYYAVRRGWQGSKVYESLDEAERNVTGLPKAILKNFEKKERAEAWLLEDPHDGANGSSTCYIPSPSELVQAFTFFKEKGFVCDGVSLEQVLDSSSQKPTPQPIFTEAELKTDHDSNDGVMSTPSCLLTPPPSLPAALQQPISCEEAPLAPEPSITLSSEQQAVLGRVMTGQNVLFTGSAGTGKSVLIREIIKWCRGHGVRLAVTASTGIAAVNIGGSTLHSFAGVGLGKEDKEVLIKRILGERKYLKRKRDEECWLRGLSPEVDEGYYSDRACQPNLVKKWRNTDALIIDEISMVDGKFFDKLEYIARYIRKNNKPFGGIQLIICGDFCQLPPVPDQENEVEIPSTFAFEANSWDRCIGPPIVLVKVFRQEDEEFIHILDAVRFARLTPEIIATLEGLKRRVVYEDGIEPTELYCTRDDVDVANHYRLRRIKKESREYKAVDEAGWDHDRGQPVPKDKADRLLKRLVAQESITLKEGAQVMLIKNLVQGSLVNGTIGKVTEFLTASEASGRGYRIGIPAPDPDKDKEEETVEPWRNGRKKPQQKRRESYLPDNTERYMNSMEKYPLVYFPVGHLGSGQGVHVLCIPTTFDVNNSKGKIEAMRTQVPLILAWALSIHKSQGQTLQRVRVNLGKAFEKGQVYVALSRAVSMKTLEVVDFDPAKVMINDRAFQWACRHMPQVIPE